MSALNERQSRYLRAVAARGWGISVPRNTAKALAARGLATISGREGIMATGVSLTLSPEGTAEALALWREHAKTIESRHGAVDDYTASVIARLEAKVTA